MSSSLYANMYYSTRKGNHKISINKTCVRDSVNAKIMSLFSLVFLIVTLRRSRMGQIG
jgi:hypothetical protein